MSQEEAINIDSTAWQAIQPHQWGRLTPIRERAQTPEGHPSTGRKFSRQCYDISEGQAATSILDVQKIYSHCELFDKCSSEFVRSLLTEGGESAVQGIIYDPQTDIVKQGTVGHSMYILHRGEAEVLLNETCVKVLKSGALFGEMNLLGLTATRTATVRCISICHLFEVKSSVFVDLLLRFRSERRHFEKVAMARYRELVDYQKKEGRKMFLAGKGTDIAQMTSKFKGIAPSEELKERHQQKKNKKKQQPQSGESDLEPVSPNAEAKGPLRKDKGARRNTGEKANDTLFVNSSDGAESASMSFTAKMSKVTPNSKSRTESADSEELPGSVHEEQKVDPSSPKGPGGKTLPKRRNTEELEVSSHAYVYHAEKQEDKMANAIREEIKKNHRGSLTGNPYKVDTPEANFVQRVTRSLRGDTRRGFMMPAYREEGDGDGDEMDETGFLDPQLLPPVGLLSPTQKHSLLRQLRQQAHFKMKRGVAKIQASLLMNKQNFAGLAKQAAGKPRRTSKEIVPIDNSNLKGTAST